MSGLLLVFLVCLSSRCFGQSYEGFGYSVTNEAITITNYTGSGGAITIPSLIPGVNGTVTAIGKEAFFVGRLASVTIPATVTSIGDSAFCNCFWLTYVSIPTSVTNIGFEAFAECDALTNVTMPTGVTSIGHGAFLESGLTNVTIPSTVSSIGAEAFALCYGLTAITVDPQNPSYSSLGGILFDKEQTTLLGCPGGDGGDYTIPSTVTSIEDGAFYGRSLATCLQKWCSMPKSQKL